MQGQGDGWKKKLTIQWTECPTGAQAGVVFTLAARVNRHPPPAVKSQNVLV